MKRFYIAVAMVVSIFLSGPASAEADLRDLFQREQNSLGKLPDRHLKSLLTASGPQEKMRPQTVNFTLGWLDKQPAAKGDAQWRCLAEALYFEARGETVKGQFAVAEVILNRVKSARFPGTLCSVINQGTGRKYQCQFTYTCDGHKEVIAEPKAFERVSKVARAAIDGMVSGLTGGATHYHTTSVRPSWARVYTKTAAIGVHLFYRHNYRTASSE
ncbi:cell wall hydrolase [Arenibacterium sp. CAU 1754]